MKPKTVGRFAGQKTSEAPLEIPPHSVGLFADGIILTMDGEKRIDEVNVGDRVITRDRGAATVRGVVSRQLTASAICVLAGSLGHTRPERDVILPSGQPVMVRDWRARALFGTPQAMVPAHQLIDGEFITDEGRQEMTLYHLQFDAPHILYVDGLELASDASMVQAQKGKAA